MVYVITDTEDEKDVLLVRAENQEELTARLRIKETQRIVGRFTDVDIKVLDSTTFTVVSS